MCIRDRAIDDPELIQELYDATGYSSKKIRERKKIVADNGFSLDLSCLLYTSLDIFLKYPLFQE